MKIAAFYVAEQILLKELRNAYAGVLVYENPSEMLYRVEGDQYAYFFDYGAVVFANMSDIDESKNLVFLRQFSQNSQERPMSDEFDVRHEAAAPLTFHFDYLVTPRLDKDVLKIVMLNLAQSVTLDYYAERAQALLAEVRAYSHEMERTGNVRIGQKDMLRFIGRALNSKNKIVENFFVFDAPDQTWEDEYLDKIHRGLTRTLEVQPRFREIEYTFKIVEDNLAVFRELYMHRESSRLEWIIILLICIEVAHLLYEWAGEIFK